MNVTHKKPYKRYEGKTNDVLIAFIGYVNDLNKLQQFKLSVQNPTIDFKALFNPLGNNRCSSPEVVLAFLLYEGSTVHNASDQYVICLSFINVVRLFMRNIQTAVSLHPLKIGHMFI